MQKPSKRSRLSGSSIRLDPVNEKANDTFPAHDNRKKPVPDGTGLNPSDDHYLANICLPICTVCGRDQIQALVAVSGLK